MGENSAIEWTDHTFNPWWGCSKVSPACTNCYAETLANRFRPDERLWRGERSRTSPSAWKAPLAWDRKAAKDGTRPRVFCASMADVFEDRDDLIMWRWDLMRLIRETPNLTWLLLTKRPDHMARRFERVDTVPANVWVGTTVEDQQRADERIPHLLRVPAPVRFLSCEPLLGPVDLTPWLGGYVNGSRVCCGNPDMGPDGPECCGCPEPEVPAIQWVITGGESGPRARPSHPDWFRALRDQCSAARVPFLFKQWGEWVSDRDKPFRTDLRVAAWVAPDGRWGSIQPQPEGAAWVARVGKAAAGRLLDGVQHDGFPEVTP